VSGSASVDTINIGALTDSAADQTTLDGYIAQVTAAIGTVASGAANLGAIKNRISNNSEFVKSLMDSVDRGIGQLVDADMNQESTRLAALQVQQQLGVQALSIANNNSQSILSLFR
jgi:flagellin